MPSTSSINPRHQVQSHQGTGHLEKLDRIDRGTNWIWMPTLEDINFGENFIIDIKTVRKMYCPSLVFINICNFFFCEVVNNSVLNYETLTQATVQPCFKHLIIEYSFNDPNRGDWSWVFKMQSQEMGRLCR